MTPDAPRDQHLSVAIFIDALGKVLGAHADAIGAADRALADELGDDQPYRDARDGCRPTVPRYACPRG